jgi:hypothetical protein
MGLQSNYTSPNESVHYLYRHEFNETCHLPLYLGRHRRVLTTEDLELTCA